MKSGVNKVPNWESPKSINKALLLTLFFGPFGMFYSTIKGAIVMLILSIIIGLMTAGAGLLFTHPLSIVWSVVAVVRYNRNLQKSQKVKDIA
jgi:hypothetical protein